MAVAEKEERISVEEYLNEELTSEVRHEYVDGHVYAMAGASKNHNRLTANLSRDYGVHLKGKNCEVMTSDMKLKLPNEYRYPDLMVVCDDNFLDDGYATKTPVLIVEVLSKNTRRVDENIKRFSYQNISTLQEYILVEQDIVRLEIFRRSEGWIPRTYYLGDDIYFESIDLTLSVSDIYDRVDNDEMIEFHHP